jgi:hypothetical protein
MICPKFFAVPSLLTTICDDGNALTQDAVKYAGTATFQTTILNGQTGMVVNTFDGNGDRFQARY